MLQKPASEARFVRSTGRGGGVWPPASMDAVDQQGSTLRRQARILVDVHLGLPGRAVDRCGNHSFTPLPRMNNLHSFDS
jgi:hypothetical protein